MILRCLSPLPTGFAWETSFSSKTTWFCVRWTMRRASWTAASRRRFNSRGWRRKKKKKKQPGDSNNRLHASHTHDMDVPLHLDLRQASVCLPAILFKTPLSVPKDSIVNVQLFAPPAPQHWAVTNILMYSCACLAEHCIACMFCEICFQFCVIIFLLEKGSSEGMYSLFSLYI